MDYFLLLSNRSVYAGSMIAKELARVSRKAVLLGQLKPRRKVEVIHPLDETERVMARNRLDYLEVSLSEGVDCYDEVLALRRTLI